MDRSVKLLLTLLVLLGGLSVAPAQARPCPGASARVEQMEATRNAAASIASALARHVGEAAQRHAIMPGDGEPSVGSDVVHAPTIRHGDQALE
jgi:hypothetical protein